MSKVMQSTQSSKHTTINTHTDTREHVSTQTTNDHMSHDTTYEPSILAIETSCDETAISFLKGFKILSHNVHTQAHLHAEFGGVFPNLAKREHVKNILPVLLIVFHEVFNFKISANIMCSNITSSNNISDSDQSNQGYTNINNTQRELVLLLLSKEQQLGANLLQYIETLSPTDFKHIKQHIDIIAVTHGPGLEPALWVGISFAKALSVIFEIPLMPINHMEGHIASVIANNTNLSISQSINFPALALLISGGHTELIHIPSWHKYYIIGHTIDDAIGEAYDKTARALGLPYPGGPEISKLAKIYRSDMNITNNQSINTNSLSVTTNIQNLNNSNINLLPQELFTLPRPMKYSKDYNFSFSGLKTAVVYAIRDRIAQRENKSLYSNEKIALAGEFESAVIDVITHKTKRALAEYNSASLIIGGGVIANTEIRSSFEQIAKELQIDLHLPQTYLATDNATMIGIVAVLKYLNNEKGFLSTSPQFNQIIANGNLNFKEIL